MTIEMARSIIDAKLAELEYEYKDSALDFNLPYIKALKAALKALEQYDVLDKIRAEIEELDRYYDNDYFSTDNSPLYKRNEVLQIIDKYKAESEEQKCR